MCQELKLFKTCKVCLLEKPVEVFQKQGHQCRKCRSADALIKGRAKVLTEEEKIERKRVSREWYLNNTERSRQKTRESEYRTKYGITIEQYNEMLKIQENVCALCGGLSNNGNNLAVDHDHTTGKVRGLLCRNCNTALGLLKESVRTMSKAIAYIELHTTAEETV